MPNLETERLTLRTWKLDDFEPYAAMCADAEVMQFLALDLTVQRSLYVIWGPPHVGGMLEPAALLATLILAVAVRRQRPAFSLTVLAVFMLLVAFPVVFFWLVQPANVAFRQATAVNVPDNWQQLRQRWESGHALRFALQLAAFACLVGSVLFESGRNRHAADRRA